MTRTTPSGPSVVPDGARSLEPSEQEALASDMNAIVQSSHLFKSLDDAGRQILLGSGFVMRFEAGEEVLREGDAGTWMYLIMQGTLRIETRTAHGTLQLAELSRGACVGEVSVLTGGRRTATVIAKTRADLLVFAKHRIERLLEAYPRVRKLLETVVEARARDTVDKILSTEEEDR